MNKTTFTVKALLAATLLATYPPAFAGILTQRAQADFQARQKNGDLPRLPDKLTADERAALQFLYAYMPLGDVADFTPEFYLQNVQSTLQARDEMPWGKSVPEREWRHFVLPVRINNEMLDMARPSFFAELKERVKGLTMEDAILEVNHWCHEKVTYRPSDARTLPPLSAVRTALGRCGEESTFTVAALRSVGIPARQVYTPRWAHTDDNHAWVEAWANGKWYFLGACEPEAVLNLGWFNAPAARGMLMTTNAFGNYDGPEEQLDKNSTSTKINVTSGYALVKDIKVKVVDSEGKPIDEATVYFTLYNYAEFYPLAVKHTDSQGETSLLAGLGDLVVWATDGLNYGLAKVNSSTPQNVVTLSYDKNYSGSFDMDLNPPHPGGNLPNVTAEQSAENERRKALEDSIRSSYTSTFITAEQSAFLAKELNLDSERLCKVMADVRGNRATVESFLRKTSDRNKALLLLENVSVKDLGDISAEVLEDRMLVKRPAGMPDSIFGPYVLSPRIGFEGLRPFHALLEGMVKKHKLNDAHTIRQYVEDNVSLEKEWNPMNYAITPAGVFAAVKGDENSRKSFAVALARTAGVPARINPVNGNLEIGMDEIVRLHAGAGSQPEKTDVASGNALVSLKDVDGSTPKYYHHFTFSQIENGLPRLMEYPEDADVQTFASGAAMEPGQYLLLSGRRMADGGVLVHGEIFHAPRGEKVEKELQLRKDDTRLSVIGNFNSERLYRPLGQEAERSLLSTTGRGYYVLGLISPGHEPSAHALNDLSAAGKEIEALGQGKVVVLMNESDANRYEASLFPNLPGNVVLGIDTEGTKLKDLCDELHLKSETKPLFIVADTFNRIVWSSQGYNIGLGNSLLEVLKKCE